MQKCGGSSKKLMNGVNYIRSNWRNANWVDLEIICNGKPESHNWRNKMLLWGNLFKRRITISTSWGYIFKRLTSWYSNTKNKSSSLKTVSSNRTSKIGRKKDKKQLKKCSVIYVTNWLGSSSSYTRNSNRRGTCCSNWTNRVRNISRNLLTARRFSNKHTRNW